MREPGSVPSLARLGFVVGSMLVGAVLLFHVRSSSTTISVAPKSVGAVAAQVSQSAAAKLQWQARSSAHFATAIAPTQALADSWALSNSANVNTDLRTAEKLMVAAPPLNGPRLQGIDPRRLRASFQRGMAAMQVTIVMRQPKKAQAWLAWLLFSAMSPHA